MVKIITHQLFSFAAAVAALKLLRLLNPPMVVVAALIALISNGLIDGLGHAKSGNCRRRTALTHSLTGALLTAVATAAMVILIPLLLGLAIGAEQQPGSSESALMPFGIALSSLISCFAHLLADLPTEGGIFYKKRRVSLGHFRYDGPINALYILCSIGLLLLAFA